MELNEKNILKYDKCHCFLKKNILILQIKK